MAICSNIHWVSSVGRLVFGSLGGQVGDGQARAQRRDTAQWSGALELVFIRGEKKERGKYADIFYTFHAASRRLIIPARFILAFLIKNKK